MKKEQVIDKNYLLEKSISYKDSDINVLGIQSQYANSRAWTFAMFIGEKKKIKLIENFILFMLQKAQDSAMEVNKYGKSFIEGNDFKSLNKEDFLHLLDKIKTCDLSLPVPLVLESEMNTFVGGYTLSIKRGVEYRFVVETGEYYIGFNCYNSA